jgi:protein gp37
VTDKTRLENKREKNLGDTTRISWSNRTQNFWIGCRSVSEGCDRCYARARINKLRGTASDPHPFDRIVRTKTWGDPYRWQREAAAAGRIDLVFTCSFSDFFIQQADEWRPAAWAIIKNTPNLIYQILTKRPDLIPARLPPDWRTGYSNVWLGTSVESKKYLPRLNVLRKIPAAARFASLEPLLEDICPDFEQHVEGLHQAIVGGESGNGGSLYRPMDHEWARRILKICRRHGVAFFFKQSAAARTEMGTLLDGKMYHEWPSHYAEYQNQVVLLK